MPARTESSRKASAVKLMIAVAADASDRTTASDDPTSAVGNPENADDDS